MKRGQAKFGDLAFAFEFASLAFAFGLLFAPLQIAYPKDVTASEVTPQVEAGKAVSSEPMRLKVEFNTSEPLGLLRFINGICKQSDEGESYYNYFIAHHKLNKDDKELIRQYARFRRLHRSNEVFETASGRKLNLPAQLMSIACSTRSFEAFFKEAKQYCNEDEYAIVEETMNHFRPVYEQLIWKPFSPQLSKDVAWFRENEQSFSRPLETVARLYQSSAGRTHALKAVLVPVPTEVEKLGKGFHFTTSAHSENLDVAVIFSIGIVPPDAIASFNDARVNNDRTLDDNDVLVHEFAHTLWGFRDLDFKKSLIAYFDKYGTQFNYDLLNESQAAAMQAWFYKQVHGKNKGGKWYDNSYVDRYAKALFPVLEQYADSVSSAGELNADDYAQKAIKTFEATFPNWQNDPQIILWRSQVVQSPLSADDLVDEFDEKMFEFGSGDHKVILVKGETWPDKFKNFSRSPHMTTIFLITPGQLDAIQKYFGLSDQITQELESLICKNKINDTAIVKAAKTEQRWLVFSIANRQTLQKQGLLDYARQTGKN